MPTQIHDIQPKFNPTGAPEADVYPVANIDPAVLEKRGDIRVPTRLLPDGSPDPDHRISLWRVEQRSRVEDGTGITSSRVLAGHSAAEPVGRHELNRHLSSSNESRVPGSGKETSYVSFITSAKALGNMALRNGYGLKGFHDAVVVEASVHPSRLVYGPSQEILLTGGLSPDEYVGAHDVKELIAQHIDPDTKVRIPHQPGEHSIADTYAHWGAMVEPPTPK